MTAAAAARAEQRRALRGERLVRHHHAAFRGRPGALRGPIALRPYHGVVAMPAGATDPTKDAALIVDGTNGKVLYARNETAERHPASLTKMMTLYLLFERLKEGKIKMTDEITASDHSSDQKPTKLGLKPGESIPVETAIQAIVIVSANDVAVQLSFVPTSDAPRHPALRSGVRADRFARDVE